MLGGRPQLPQATAPSPAELRASRTDGSPAGAQRVGSPASRAGGGRAVDALGAVLATAVASRGTPEALPSGLRHGIESLSGVTMAGVRLHRDSPRPAQIGALAFAEGSEIHLGPGQESHLAHEAWHVAQQRGGAITPTRRLRGRSINDDPVLEREAETMGSRALAGVSGLRGRTALRAAVDAAPVLQGVFPDAYNQARHDEQTITVVQLDHIVPQKTLKEFARTLGTLSGLTDEPGSRWELTQEALLLLRAELGKLHRMDEFAIGSEAQLINLPENIVPGRTDQIQGAGDRFDAQVAVVGQGVQATALTASLRPMDVAIRQLNVMVDKELLPAKASSSKNARLYDRTTDQLLASLLAPVTAGLHAMTGATEPTYDANVWYAHAGGYVKKRAAEWLANVPVGYGLTPVPAHPVWNHQFNFTVKAIVSRAGKPAVVDVGVTVNVTIPPLTWSHIYARHYLPTFQHVVEAVNTFWKVDPHAFLTGAGIPLLESELQYILRRSFALAKTPDNVEEHDSEDADWSETSHDLFFQGTADLVAGDPTVPAQLYTIDVLLKSIAPERADLGFALLPQNLP